MQPLEIDSAVFCDGAHYTIISRENSSILTCPVTSGAGGYTLNRVGGSEIDREIDRLTGHAACIAVEHASHVLYRQAILRTQQGRFEDFFFLFHIHTNQGIPRFIENRNCEAR